MGTQYKFGDIVLISYQYPDQTAFKIRPALVISSDEYNEREADRILLPITSNVSRGSVDDVVVKVTDPDFRQTGLKVTSAIRAGKIFTADRRVVARRLGCANSMIIEAVQARLRRVLNL